jgi:hypothetical protein
LFAEIIGINMTLKTITAATLAATLLIAFTQVAAFSDQNVLLQGEVKEEVVAALSQLHEVRVAEEKVKRASEDLYQESTRPQITMEEEPDIIGDTVMELPVPVQTGLLLPPRAKWVNRFMDDLDKLVPMLKEEVGDVAIPDTNKTDETQLYNFLVAATDVIDQRFNTLKQLCTAPPYDQVAMANASAVIHQAVKEMETARKHLYELLRKTS